MPFEKIARIYERVGMLQEAVQSFMQGAESQLKRMTLTVPWMILIMPYV